MRAPEWQWNEFQQVGTDYADFEEVAKYDTRMATFRDVEAENRRILDTLALSPGSRVLEIGCGTGHFARAAAAAGHQVTALDVSPIMLEFVAQKTDDGGLMNLETQNAGFLTMDLPAGHFDGAVSVVCLHHLPDLWKLVALENVCRTLKPGGQLFLSDVVFSIARERSAAEFDGFLSCLPDTIRPAAAQHVAKEYSTLDWIMEGLLQRAGFDVLSAEPVRPSIIAYHCRVAAAADNQRDAKI